MNPKTKARGDLTSVAVFPPQPTSEAAFPDLNVYLRRRPPHPRHLAVWVVAKAMEPLPGDPISYAALVYKVATCYHIGADGALGIIGEALSTPSFEVEPRETAA